MTRTNRRSGYFNPRSPHGERHNAPGVMPQESAFQSTLPARGATDPDGESYETKHISIHAPRTGSDWWSELRKGKDDISIHAPRTGSDTASIIAFASAIDFNPRSPHGERPLPRLESRNDTIFQSTLPARGATAVVSHACGLGADFNPRSPHGERPNLFFEAIRIIKISIHAPRTGSDRGALPDVDRRPRISIHAPRTGSDP